jgi:S-adenosylmethionine-diacylglycerol 3-amino-3-carboxypropyl transferase
MRTGLVENAVYNTPAASTKGVLDRLFAFWFKRFVYNQIWEDPRVDLEALRLTRSSRLVTIASGGCNVLNYLVADPAAIVAVDLNPAHIALTRLKLVAAQQLPDHESFFRLFGAAADPANRQTYFSVLRPHLDAQTRAFWEERTITRKRRLDYFADGLYRRALLGRFIGLLHGLAAATGRRPARLLGATSLAEQQRIFDETTAPLFDLAIVRLLCRLPMMSYSLGIPPAQFTLLRRQAAGNVARLYRDRVRHLACDFPIGDNYFAWQAFGRAYDLEHRQAVPDYLRAENYPRLRERAHRVVTKLASMTDFLAGEPAGSLDRYVLLDAQDWMSGEQQNALWREIDRTAAAGARVIFRTAAEEAKLAETLAPTVISRWHYERELSRSLLARDRSAIYGGFHLYILPAAS